MTSESSLADETTSLLANETPHAPTQKPTPLPLLQISIPLLLRACEALTVHSVEPFINQLVGELDIVGGDKRKVGYYVGLIGTSYGIATGISAFQWNRLSDHAGRKPVVLIGLFGSALSMICFGLSRTFLGLIASRCLWGLLDGTVGVAKSIIGETTDSSNQAKVFGWLMLASGVAKTIAPLIGGTLAKPNQRFPSFFSGEFWKSYPYFLPCLVTAGIIFSAFVFAFYIFRETAPTASGSTEASSPDDKPLPLRKLLTYPVLISAANYTSMPINIGGLGLHPLQIGYIISLKTALSSFALALLIHPLTRRFGERPLFVYAMAAHIPLWILYPLMNMYAKAYGMNNVLWTGVGVMSLLSASDAVGFSCIYVIIVAAAPNRKALGATNGVSQTAVTFARIVAPALVTSLFSLSVERRLLGGYAVYLLLCVCSFFAVWLARCLLSDHASLEDPEETGA